MGTETLTSTPDHQADALDFDRSASTSPWAKPVYTLAIFVSAFLLFLVQPMFARMVLPQLGGSPAVWNTALVFYQATLLLGYAYAHWASQRLIGRRWIWHVLLLIVGFSFLPIRLHHLGEPPSSGTPVFWLLGMLALGVGVPFFFVSTTSPLLQRWFSRTGHRQAKNPYFLYAASNVGSLLALLGYPLVVEPQLRLLQQSGLWSLGFVVLALLVAACGAFLPRSATGPAIAEVSSDPIPWKRRGRWVLLAFVPSALLMGVTTYITTEIAAVPLLWVGPLAIYLLTFILTFADKRWLPHGLVRVLAPLAIVAPLVFIVGTYHDVRWVPLATGFAGFFVCAMLCHGELSDNKPPADRLTEFYLWVSLGGVLGGIFCGLLAPVLFKQVLEYPIALVLCAGLAPAWAKKASYWDVVLPVLVVAASIWSLYELKRNGTWFEQDTWKAMLLPGALTLLAFGRPVRMAASVAAFVAIPLFWGPSLTTRIYQSRGFFGTLIVRSYSDMNVLLHGTTLHGLQLKDDAHRDSPVSYYHPTGPVGDFLIKRHRPVGARMGVVGLGVGTLTSYSEPGEDWTVYDIDPEVVKVSSNPKYFTYLQDAKGHVDIVLGDARVSLTKSHDEYDVLMLDAYSSDAVPVHLITKEAFEVYMKRLRPGGLLAVHISNRYMHLWPVVASAARELGLVERRRNDRSTGSPMEPGKDSSEWCVLTRTVTDLGPIAKDPEWKEDSVPAGFHTWTDDRSSLLQVLIGSPWDLTEAGH